MYIDIDGIFGAVFIIMAVLGCLWLLGKSICLAIDAADVIFEYLYERLRKPYGLWKPRLERLWRRLKPGLELPRQILVAVLGILVIAWLGSLAWLVCKTLWRIFSALLG